MNVNKNSFKVLGDFINFPIRQLLPNLTITQEITTITKNVPSHQLDQSIMVDELVQLMKLHS